MQHNDKIIPLYPDANDTVRHLREKSPYEPMLPDDIVDAMLEESRQRAREMVFSIVVFAFAFVGAAWMLGYLVGMATR